jgi:hypothetical protein
MVTRFVVIRAIRVKCSILDNTKTPTQQIPSVWLKSGIMLAIRSGTSDLYFWSAGSLPAFAGITTLQPEYWSLLCVGFIWAG